jgi:hypothetical protein
MQTESNTEKNITTEIINSAPWRLTKVKPLKNYVLEVSFIDGTHGIVEMEKQILSPTAGVFAKLRNQKIFNKVYLDYGAVTWPGELDLAPDAMHSEIKKHGRWIVG